MSSAQPSSRLAVILAGGSLFAALAWLVSRVFLGVCFTDEMLYYGEIGGLVRTGRFFQDDLAIQQLGYLFLYPFFKLHALVWPGQDYFILFGRLLLVAAYAGTGMFFWRAAGRLGRFSLAQKLTGLAAFFAWIPFQIFAFSYNTTSYLLSVILAAVWLTRDPGQPARYAVTVAALLTVLTYTYPPVGLLFILTATLEADRRLNRRAALTLLGATALFGGAVLALLAAMHGGALVDDLVATIRFSRGFSVANTLRMPDHLASLLTLVLVGGIFLRRRQLGRPFRQPLGEAAAPALRWAGLAVVVTGGAALLGLAMNWKTGYFSVSAFLTLWMVLASSVGPDDGERPLLRVDNPALFRWAQAITLAAGGTALLFISLRWSSGYNATVVLMLVLMLLAIFSGPEAGAAPGGLAVLGLVLGSGFAVTSSNGMHNFGVGAAGALPFLFLYAARAMDGPGAGWTRRLAGSVLAVLIGFLLSSGITHPYGEQLPWKPFKPITSVPAFRGLWTSPEKIEAIEKFQALAPAGGLQGRRTLVIGPHPWLYFVLGGQPATPMFFMLYIGTDESYEVVAARMFRDGMPDIVMLTDTSMPGVFAAKLTEWSNHGYEVQQLRLPADFIGRFGLQTGVEFSSEVFLLGRPPAPPRK